MMPETLDAIIADIAERIARGAQDRKSPLHTPCVVTADVDARIMVLRGFDSEAWTLRFHTDARAPKVAAIEADPRIAVLFYDHEAGVQLRAQGTARVLREGEAVDKAWSASTNFARRCYLGEPPGAPSDSPTSGLPPQFEGAEPDGHEIAPARENFALLLANLETVDGYYLAHTGHRRAVFERSSKGDWAGRWLAP